MTAIIPQTSKNCAVELVRSVAGKGMETMYFKYRLMEFPTRNLLITFSICNFIAASVNRKY